MVNPVPVPSRDSVDKFRSYLLHGNKVEGLEFAMKGGLHWLVGNITGSDLSTGQTLCQYLGTCFHRFPSHLCSTGRRRGALT